MFKAAQVFHLSFVQCRWSVKVFSLTQRVLCLLCTIALCTVQLFNFLTCHAFAMFQWSNGAPGNSGWISLENLSVLVLNKNKYQVRLLIVVNSNECFSRHGDETDDFLSALSFIFYFFNDKWFNTSESLCLLGYCVGQGGRKSLLALLSLVWSCHSKEL